jgi:hypothetical protein
VLLEHSKLARQYSLQVLAVQFDREVKVSSKILKVSDKASRHEQVHVFDEDHTKRSVDAAVGAFSANTPA